MNPRAQPGFTLIEMAIVLLVIGILLGGVVKGQQLINNARVKSLAADFRTVPAQLYAYQDRFRASPGDDFQVAAHVPGSTTATTPAGTLGNGVINGVWNTVTNTDESCLFWQHVRLADLAVGTSVVNCAAGGGYYPQNANGGQVGIQGNSSSVAAFPTFSSGTGPPGTFVVCSSNIPGQFVLQLDAMLDDGDPSAGAMRAIQTTQVGNNPATTAIVSANPGDSFIVCMGY